MAAEKEIIKDIARVAARLGVTALSRSRYLQFAKFSGNQIYDGGRTWTELCSKAGLATGANNEPVSDEVYFQRLADAIAKLGRFPKASERKLFGLNISKSRYTNFTEFIRAAVRQGKVSDPHSDYMEKQRSAPVIARAAIPIHATQTEAPRMVPPIPRVSKRSRWERTDIVGFPYAPQDESGVVALFAIFCAQGILRWQILDLNSSKGTDCICYDEKSGKEIRVEIKYLLTRSGWNHPIEDVDYVVCWESRWHDFPKRVFELKKLVGET